MEPVSKIIQMENRLPEKSSSTATIVDIPRDKKAAMGDVLDRWRLNQGFNPYDNQTQDLAIQSWCHMLDRDGVPHDVYNELYERSLKTRALAIQNGKELPRMGAELLLAHWLGENGLQKELREKSRIAADRRLEMGGEPCPDDIREQLKRFGIKV